MRVWLISVFKLVYVREYDISRVFPRRVEKIYR